jgi:integrase
MHAVVTGEQAMSVKVRPYQHGDGWEVDILFRLPNGRRHRERSKAPVSSKSGALRWGQDRERHLLQYGPEQPKKEVPTLESFVSRFVDGYALANRQKPSGVAAKRTILNVHLVPALGSKRLDAITNEDIQRLKHQLRGRASKTVNNVLTVLSVLLKKAVEWDVIDRMPCTIRLLRVTKPSMGFYDFDEYEQLVGTAKAMDPDAHLIVLLGGEAGLRCGEMIGLEWDDVDLGKRQLCIQRSEWRGHVTVPKGGRLRYVPMTARLASALRDHRHLKGQRVLCQNDGSPLTQDIVGEHVRRAGRKAEVPASGAHRLRHTFCSHLAMRGAPARAIQELAGHQDLVTTQRYMHLSPTAIESAIKLLEQPQPSQAAWRNAGDGR